MQREHNAPGQVHHTAGGLPDSCYSVLLSDPHQLIKITRGVIGYTPIKNTTGNESAIVARDLNEGLTPKQIEAMKAGSMFGWDTPAADPAIYDEHGKTKPRDQWPEEYRAQMLAPSNKPARYKITVSAEERDAILAALRWWHKDGAPDFEEIASNGGEHEVLEDEEIDELCERVNCG